MTSPWGWDAPRRNRGYNDLHSDGGGTKKQPLHYAPWNGRFFFWYNGRLLVFRRVRQSKELHSAQEEVSISCFGGSPKVLRELLSECRSQYLKLAQNKTSVFEHRDDTWKRSIVRDIRPISTVILSEKMKRELLKISENSLTQELEDGIQTVAFLTEEATCCMDLLGLGSPV